LLSKAIALRMVLACSPQDFGTVRPPWYVGPK